MALLVHSFLHDLHHSYADYRCCHYYIDGHRCPIFIRFPIHGVDIDIPYPLAELSSSKNSLYVKDSLGENLLEEGDSLYSLTR